MFGNVPRMMREIRSQRGEEDSWVHKLHVELGPIYKIRMMGMYESELSPAALSSILKS